MPPTPTFASCALAIAVAAHSAFAASAPSSTCLDRLIASRGTTPSRNTCTSCYNDNMCCPTMATSFGVVECSSSVSSLAQCAPSGRDACSIDSRRLWIAIFVPFCFLTILCVLGFFYCGPAKAVPRGEAVGESAPAPVANEACFEPRGFKKSRRGAFIQVRV